jgi:hypothetical protein
LKVGRGVSSFQKTSALVAVAEAKDSNNNEAGSSPIVIFDCEGSGLSTEDEQTEEVVMSGAPKTEGNEVKDRGE